MAKAKKKVKALKKKPILKKKAAAKKVVKAKKKKVAPIPKGYHAITPYLIVNKGKKALEFYKKAFGAKATICMEHSDGTIGHAELKIGDSIIMLGDECADMKAYSPEHFKGSPVSIHFYVKDVDAVVKKAVGAGATLIKPVADQFYGDRSGGLQDPFGHYWYVSTHVEDLTMAQIKKRAKELFGE